MRNSKLIPFIFIFLVFNSCNRQNSDCGCMCQKNNLLIEVPYKKSDNKYFIDSLGNKLEFKLDKVNNGYFKKIEGGHNPDCGGTMTYENQFSNIFFEEKNENATLFIGNYANGDTIYNFSSTLIIGVNGVNFVFWTVELLNNFNVIPEIKLNNKIYKKVFFDNPYNKNTSQKIYFNFEKGILAFKTDSIMWFLDE